MEYNKTEFNNTIIDLHENISFNPYLILNILPSYTKEQLKIQYKYYAFKTHPDKGGNAEHFQLVSKAYIYLLKALKYNLPMKPIQDLKDDHNEYIKDQTLIPKKNINLYSKKFNLKKFNSIFEDNRIDNEYDKGYSDFLKDTTTSNNTIDNSVFSTNFNLNLFNQIFNNNNCSNEHNSNNKQLIKNYEPTEMCSSNGYQLGIREINDFSSNFNICGNNSLDYTDIRVAYTTSKLVDESLVNMPTYTTVEQLKQERSNIIPLEISDKDKLYRERIALEKQIHEQTRLQNLIDNDTNIIKHYNKINKLMLN